MRELIAGGLAWLYDTVQPEGAILQHHGAIMADNDRRRTYRFIPQGWNNLPVVVADAHHRRDEHGRVRFPGGPLTRQDRADLIQLVESLGAQVAHTWNNDAYATTSLGLLRPAHPTLLAAVARYRAGCPDHRHKDGSGDVFCRCGWYRRGLDLVVFPRPEAGRDA